MPLAKTKLARALSRIKIHNGWSMDQLAKEIGCSERTLSRYLADGVMPRNNKNGDKIWKRTDELLKLVPSEVRAKPIKRGRDVGVYITPEFAEDVRSTLVEKGVYVQTLASLTGISYSHLTSILNRKTRTSQETIDRIAEVMITGDFPSTSEESVISPSPTYHYEVRPGMTVGIILPADLTQREAERLAFFIQSLPKE